MTAQQKSLNVFVIGDICEDIYYYAHSNRKNPESDAPLYTVVHEETLNGMADNVSYCINALNIDTVLHSHICIVPTKKIRIIDDKTKKQIFRLDVDVEYPEIKLSDNFGGYDAVVISDYNKGTVSDNTIHKIMESYKGLIFLDTKKKNLKDFEGCIIKINENEAKEAHSLPDKNLIITMGGHGAISIDDVYVYPALKSKVVDVCGAGDAFLAGLVYGHLKQHEKPIVCGIVNASLSVRHLGVYAPSEEELLKGLEEYNDTINWHY